MVPKFERGAKDVKQVEDAVARVLDPILRKLDWTLLDSGTMVTFSAGVTRLVLHRLGKRVRFWRVVDQDAAATFYRDRSSTADLNLYLPLRADVAVNASFEVAP